MPDQAGERVKVILKWVQITDNLEPPGQDTGEFRFRVRVSSRNRGGIAEEVWLPRKKKFYRITDMPGWNRKELDQVVFEGEVDDHLEVELHGEELDFLSPDDQLETYHRVFEGPPSSWFGEYYPGDEGGDDPEHLSNWKVCYAIQPG